MTNPIPLILALVALLAGAAAALGVYMLVVERRVCDALNSIMEEEQDGREDTTRNAGP